MHIRQKERPGACATNACITNERIFYMPFPKKPETINQDTLDRIKLVWDQIPKMRLGELLYLAAERKGQSIQYIEDDDLAKATVYVYDCNMLLKSIANHANIISGRESQTHKEGDPYWIEIDKPIKRYTPL